MTRTRTNDLTIYDTDPRNRLADGSSLRAERLDDGRLRLNIGYAVTIGGAPFIKREHLVVLNAAQEAAFIAALTANPPPPAYHAGQPVEYVSHQTGLNANRGWQPAIFSRYADDGGPHVWLTQLYWAVRTTGHGTLLSNTRELRPVPDTVIATARGWLAARPGRDPDSDERAANMTSAQVMAGIQQHYRGGWTRFRQNEGKDPA